MNSNESLWNSSELPTGKRLRLFRVRHDLTQADVARLLGLDKANISRYECGARPDLVTASKIERFTGIPASAWVAEDLVKDVPESAPDATPAGGER